MTQSKTLIIVTAIFCGLLLAVGLAQELNRVSSAQAATQATDRYVDGSNGNDSGACTSSSSPCKTLSYAVNQSVSGDTIYLANPITETGQIVLNNLELTLLQWQNKGSATLRKRDNTGEVTSARCWICLQGNTQLTVKDVAFDGEGYHVMEAIRVGQTAKLKLERTTFTHFVYGDTNSAGDTLGKIRGTVVYVEGGELEVSESDFSNFGRSAVLACGGTVRVWRSHFIGDKTEDSVLNFGLVGGNGATLKVGRSIIEGMKGTYSFNPSAGVAVIRGTNFCASSTTPSSAVITSTHILSSTVGILVGEGSGDGSNVEAHSNRLFSNEKGAAQYSNQTQNLKYNWWGCNGGPGSWGCDPVDGTIDYTPWLTLTLQLAPQSVYLGENFNATAQVKTLLYQIPDGSPVSFSGDGITFTPANTETVAGEASSLGLVGNASQSSRTVTAALDKGTASATLNIKKRLIYLPLVLREYSVWEPIFADNFNNSSNNNWIDVFGGPKFRHNPTGQELRMVAGESNKFFLTLLNRSDLFEAQKTYAIEVKARPIQNPYKFGLVLGYKEDQNGKYFFAFRIQPASQTCELRQYSGSQWISTFPCDGQKLAINPNGENLLQAEFSQTKVDFFVNGQLVYTYFFDPSLQLSGTRVGFITVGGSAVPSEIAFDDFAVYRHR